MTTPEANTPADESGDGPVTIEDRVEPGGEGSPGSNQAKTEPMSPTGTHSEPMAPPSLDEMNIGAGNPQLPSHPAVSSGAPSGSYSSAPAGTSSDVSSGGSGTSHRVPGLDGTTPDGESVESDVQAGAARMGPAAVDSTAGTSPGQGDDQGVPSSGTSPLPGSSEEHRVVSGVKLPDPDEA